MKQFFALFISLAMVSGGAGGQDLFGVSKRLWQPQKDEVYLQEVSEKIPTDKPVQSVAELDGKCYALISNKVYVLDNGELKPDHSAPSEIQKIQKENNLLWALTFNGIYLLDGKEWQKIDDKKYIDLCTLNGAV
ncbi:MAG: hypothetical protein JW761_10130, partial [Prolixibacteraceae bacterium]|nr:hypothetical protein [Prolixibacteraceae bacterium]